jgi:hypothetical protein
LLWVLLLLLKWNSALRILLEVASIEVLLLDRDLGLLELSLVDRLALELRRVWLDDWLSVVNHLVGWNLALICLAGVHILWPKLLLTNSWLIKQKVLVWHRLRRNQLLILKVGVNLVSRWLVIDWFIHSVVNSLAYRDWTINWHEFRRFLHTVIQVVVDYWLVVISVWKLSLGKSLLELLMWPIAPSILQRWLKVLLRVVLPWLLILQNYTIGEILVLNLIRSSAVRSLLNKLWLLLLGVRGAVSCLPELGNELRASLLLVS